MSASKSYQTRLMFLLSIGFGFVFLDRNAFNYLAPMIAPDLHLNNTQVGILASALAFTWALSGIIVGRISDSTGKRKSLLIASFVVFSLCSAVSGLAQSFLMLLGARLFMGLAEGPILPISQSLLALESSEGRRGLNMGVVQNFGSNLMGSFIAPLLLVWLANQFSWRVAFFLAAVPGLITAALMVKWVREPPVDPSMVNVNKETGKKDSMGLSVMLTHRNMWLCVVISCVMVAWLILGWTFLPLFYVNVRKFSSQEMSILMSALGLSAALCAIIVPWLSDRFGRKPIMILFALIGVITPAAALWFHGPLVVLIVLVFIGWSGTGIFPLFMAVIPSETLPPRMIATALGAVMGIGEIVGGAIGPAVAGWAADIYGLQTPALIQIGCTLLATVLSLFLIETAPVKVGHTPGLSTAVASTGD